MSADLGNNERLTVQQDTAKVYGGWRSMSRLPQILFLRAWRASRDQRSTISIQDQGGPIKQCRTEGAPQEASHGD